MSSAPITDQQLIAHRRQVLAVVAVGVLVVVVLAAVVWRGTTTAFDTWAFRRAYIDFPPPHSWRRRFWLLFSEPAVSFLVPTGVVLWGAATRRWNVVALAVIGPCLALGLTELIGKPLVGRSIGPGVLEGSSAGSLKGSFPSGHETALVSWLVLVLVLLFRAPVSRRVKSIGLAIGVVWALLGAMGLTVNFYHYATDTIGAMGLATATVLAVALAIDRWLPSASSWVLARGRAPDQFT